MRNNQLTFAQKHIGDVHAFRQKTARIVAQIEHQALERGRVELPQLVSQFSSGGLAETRDANVSNVRSDKKGVLDAGARNLVANDAELDRLFAAFARRGDADRGALRP